MIYYYYDDDDDDDDGHDEDDDDDDEATYSGGQPDCSPRFQAPVDLPTPLCHLPAHHHHHQHHYDHDEEHDYEEGDGDLFLLLPLLLPLLHLLLLSSRLCSHLTHFPATTKHWLLKLSFWCFGNVDSYLNPTFLCNACPSLL